MSFALSFLSAFLLAFSVLGTNIIKDIKISPIAITRDHCLLIKENGKIFYFNRFHRDPDLKKITITNNPAFVQVSAHDDIVLALDQDGRLYEYWNTDELKYNISFSLKESELNNIVAIATGPTYSIALSAQGQVYFKCCLNKINYSTWKEIKHDSIAFISIKAKEDKIYLTSNDLKAFSIENLKPNIYNIDPIVPTLEEVTDLDCWSSINEDMKLPEDIFILQHFNSLTAMIALDGKVTFNKIHSENSERKDFKALVAMEWTPKTHPNHQKSVRDMVITMLLKNKRLPQLQRIPKPGLFMIFRQITKNGLWRK